MHLNLIVRDGQRQIAIIEVQTFQSDLYVAQVAVNKPGTDSSIDEDNNKRVALPLDHSEIEALIAMLQSACKNIKKTRTP